MTFVEPEAGTDAPGGAASEAVPLTLDGVELPEALFARDPALESAFFRSDPVEEAFFTPLSAAEAARICAELAPGVEPRRRVLTDRYVDTPDLSLFRRGVSARVREYHADPRPVRFDVIALALRRPSPARRPEARVNRVLVQTFARNDAAALEALLQEHARAGLVEVARVDKTRVAFDIVPIIAETPDGRIIRGADTRTVDDVASLRLVDLGLKVVVDELRGSAFAEPTIVEVEYDAARVREAAALVKRLRAALGPGTRPKERNKITYLLADRVPTVPTGEEGEG